MFLYRWNLFIKKIIKSWNFLDNLIVLYYLKMYMNSKIACPKYFFFFSVMCPLHHMNDMQHVQLDKDNNREDTSAEFVSNGAACESSSCFAQRFQQHRIQTQNDSGQLSWAHKKMCPKNDHKRIFLEISPLRINKTHFKHSNCYYSPTRTLPWPHFGGLRVPSSWNWCPQISSECDNDQFNKYFW